MSSALAGLRIIDLSRVLAGPVCTQILGDLGADVIKIEKPGEGDDTRKWGPPFLKDAAGEDTSESAYYLSANRNKRSVAIDIAKPGGQDLVHRLLEDADVLIQNFRTGVLDKYGLDFDSVHARHPHIVYCAITGFGQTGPRAQEAGYDFLAQALGGLMASTGGADSEPMKAGVALSDVMTGQMAAIGILAALRARDTTGRGQLVDVALLDCTIAAMTNVAQYYLTSGETAPRLGNAHSTIVPYKTFAASDGHIVVAVGNDAQFKRFAALLGAGWADDAQYATNQMRVRNRDRLVPEIAKIIAAKPVAHWLDAMAAIGVPAAPVNTLQQAFAMPQAQARGMEIEMPHAAAPRPVKLVGSPLKLSETPVSYRQAPPVLGQHTDGVLKDWLGLDPSAIKALRRDGVIA